MAKKRYIKRYNALTYVQLDNCFVRKNCIEIVSEEPTGVVKVRTISGVEFILRDAAARDLLVDLGFNEKNKE